MALYHKHRPQTFDSVVGQDHIRKTIANEVSMGKLAHAYLFSGPRGVGKTTIARVLGKAINCENRKPGEAEPCNTCGSCQEIGDGRSIDVIEIDAASHTGVDNVRENIIENAQFKPTKSSYKVFIIDEVHMLSTSAFNALLKTLEEPPTHVIFILATTELHKIPETIISRCQRFDFKKVGYDMMKGHLKDVAKEEKLKIDDEVLDRIINKSDGCVRDAVSLLDQLTSSGEKHITADVASVILPTSPVEDTVDFVAACIEKNLETGLTILNALAESGIHFSQFATDILEILRTIMIYQISNKLPRLGLDLSDSVKKRLQTLGGSITPAELIRLIDLTMKRRLEVKNAPLPQLPLEMLLIEWSNKETMSNEQLTKTVTNEPAKATLQTVATEKKFEEKKTIIEKVREMVTPGKQISTNDVQTSWKDIVTKLEIASPSLVFILKMADVIDVVDNTINLSVPFPIHRDKLMDKVCQHQLQEMLSKHFDTPVHISVTVVEKAAPIEEDATGLQELAAAFGGEVIN